MRPDETEETAKHVPQCAHRMFSPAAPSIISAPSFQPLSSIPEELPAKDLRKSPTARHELLVRPLSKRDLQHRQGLALGVRFPVQGTTAATQAGPIQFPTKTKLEVTFSSFTPLGESSARAVRPASARTNAQGKIAAAHTTTSRACSLND